MLRLQRFALVQVLPVEAGAALGVAVICNEKNEMDGLLLPLRELFPGQNIGGKHASPRRAAKRTATALRLRNRHCNVNAGSALNLCACETRGVQ